MTISMYRWIGDAISEESKSKRRAKIEYKTLELPNKKRVNAGDYVLVQGDGGSEGKEEEFVAQIETLFDTGGEQDNKRATVQWFMKPDEIPSRTKVPFRPKEGELFLYKMSKGSSSTNEIDAETIVNLCTVTEVPVSMRATFRLSGNGLKAFFVSWSYNGAKFEQLQEEKEEEESEDDSEEEEEEESEDDSEEKEEEDECYPPLKATRKKTTHKKVASKAATLKTPSGPKRSHKKSVPLPATTQATIMGSSPRKIFDCEDALEALLSEEEFTPKSQKQSFKKPSKRPIQEQLDLNNNFSPKISKIEDATYWFDDLDDTIYDVVKRRNKSDKVLAGVTRHFKKEENQSTETVSQDLKRNCQTPEKLTLKNRIPKTVAKIDGREQQKTPSRRKSVKIVEPPKSCPPIRSRSKRVSSAFICEKHEEEVVDTHSGNRRMSRRLEFTEIKERNVDEEASEEFNAKSKKGRSSKATAVTPKKKQAKQSKMPSTPATSKKQRFSIRDATPQIHERATPRKAPSKPLEQARARLHVSAVPTSLPCRENEFEDIFSFVKGHLVDKVWGCLYISGVPGTGKTATIHAVLHHLEQEVADGEIDDFQTIEINGMKLTEPHQAFVQILKGVTGQKATPEHAANLLEKYFNSGKTKKKLTVLVVDELDLLWTRKQNVLYSIFDWPTKPKSGLIVVAIANTMDLPERIMMNRVSSRLGLSRMTFHPYTFKQLQEIVEVRLHGLKAFESDAIQLAARKVAALSGDARRALDICRRAAEIADRLPSKSKKVVNMSHVDSALQEMFCSPKIVAMQKASKQEQLFLRAIASEFKMSGLEEAIFSQVLKQHVNLCRIEGVQPRSVSEVWSVCLQLASLKLILLEAGFNELNKRIQLNVSQDDVRFAFRQDEI